MTALDYQAGILRAYAGELIGEAFFTRLMQTIDDPQRQRKLALLLLLETRMRSFIEPLLGKYQLALPDAGHYRAEGAQKAAELPNWEAFIAMLVLWTPPIEARYQGFLAVGPSEDRERLELLVRHEALLLQFALEEQGGGAESALAAIERMIEVIGAA